MKMLLCALLLNGGQFTPPSQPVALIHDFLRDVASEQLTDMGLADKYMCSSLFHRTGKVGDGARYFFHLTVNDYREKFKEQHIDPKDLVIEPV